MRIIIRTTPSAWRVPFNYQPKLVGTLHKWLGPNDIHGKLALHSFSWLLGGEVRKDGIDFKEGACLFISFHDSSAIRQIVRTILQDPGMFCGMKVTDVDLQDDPDLSGRELFSAGSPIFVQRSLGEGRNKHYTYEDSETEFFLVETLKHKMEEAGLPEDDTLEISFATEFRNRKIKTIYYNGIGNKSSWCPVIIKGKPETKVFAWNVGIGNGTGIGFGSIY